MSRSCASCTRLSRRAIFRGAAALGAGGLASRFGQGRLFAQSPGGGRRFVFVYIPGGWDQLLFLDPREFELNLDEAAYDREVQRTQIDTSYRYGIGSLVGNYAQGYYFNPKVYRPSGLPAEFAFGPGVAAVDEAGELRPGPTLVSLAERGVPMAIVRGINMGTLGHEAGYNYFLTGEPAVGNSARGTSMPVRIAAALGERPGGLGNTIVPVVALGLQSYTGNNSGRYGAVMLQSLTDAARMLRREPPLIEHAQTEAALSAFASGRKSGLVAAADPSGLLKQITDSHERAGALIEGKLAQRFEFLTDSDPESLSTRERYGLTGQVDPGTPSAVAAFAAQAVKHGFGQFISVAFTKNGVDTHGSANPSHLGKLYPCLRAVSQLVDDLASTPAPPPLGGSWMDNTTIVLFSEFGRTPLFNLNNGRDHHFTNSCLLIGAGIRGGAVVGASSQTGGMQPVPFDFAAQRVLPEGTKPANEKQRYILPEDVGATLLASAGLDYAEYRIGRPLWNAITAKPAGS